MSAYDEELAAKDAVIKHLERSNRELRNTLRDDFAKAALIGMIDGLDQSDHYDLLADHCYLIADAMIEARK
jgi:hypothetical protein